MFPCIFCHKETVNGHLVPLREYIVEAVKCEQTRPAFIGFMLNAPVLGETHLLREHWNHSKEEFPEALQELHIFALHQE